MMTAQVNELAYRGAWGELLHLLERQPEQVNASSAKGYTPLHQAAWHGAGPRVLGRLLALGADPTARTISRNQSPADIAFEKHPLRDDLYFLLHVSSCSPAQLLRKFAADNARLFDAYDGNQALIDRVIECLSSGEGHHATVDVEQRLMDALRAVAGPRFLVTDVTVVETSSFEMEASSRLWGNRIIPAVVDMSARAHLIPLTESYAVMSDLFDPPPAQWGLRGDPFLWREMRQALCHVPVPSEDQATGRALRGCFVALTGEEPRRGTDLRVERFARGGMSSGMVCGEAWAERLLPTLEQRARWLRTAWAVLHGAANANANANANDV